MKQLNEQQLRVLRHAAEAGGSGEFYSLPSDGAVVGGLARRGLITSWLDHNRDRRVKITPFGREAIKCVS